MRLYKLLTLAFLLLLAVPTLAQTAHGWDASGRPILVQLPSPVESASLTVNGHRLTGDVKLEGVTLDPATNTLIFAEVNALMKGAQTQGNTTISGSLTVTGSCFFGSGSAPTHTYGPVLCSHYIQYSYDAPAASTAVTIVEDVTDISDAGTTVTLTLPTATNGRRITLVNESATYSATDGGLITVAPNSKLDLVASGGVWH